MKVAAQLALEFSAPSTLAHVVQPLAAPPQWQRLVEESEEMRVGAARAKLRSLAGQICGAQKWDDVVVVGRPAEAIGSIAAARRADLIVLGVRGRSVVDQAIFGSTANHVVRAATCPVLTLRK